mmetsp:Transcript_7724/g.14539  ORF Transcript_7724/g.14539 Transcript_7724/m.14539 type:complete len:207 (-) Transcript_7724:248-868(-)
MWSWRLRPRRCRPTANSWMSWCNCWYVSLVLGTWWGSHTAGRWPYSLAKCTHISGTVLKARFSHPGMVEVGTFAVGSHLGKSVKGNTPLPSRSGTSWYNCTDGGEARRTSTIPATSSATPTLLPASLLNSSICWSFCTTLVCLLSTSSEGELWALDFPPALTTMPPLQGTRLVCRDQGQPAHGVRSCTSFCTGRLCWKTFCAGMFL